jgi:hypothetical protein
MNRTVLILFASPIVLAASPQRDRDAIVRQNDRLSRAFEQKDFRVWKEIMADDLRDYAPDGTSYDKAFMLKMGKRERSWALPPVRTNIRYSRIQVHGNRGTAHGDETTCYTVKLRSGGRAPLCYTQSSNDEWRKDKGVWKLTAMHDLPNQRFTLSGKAISHRQFRNVVGLQ